MQSPQFPTLLTRQRTQVSPPPVKVTTTTTTATTTTTTTATRKTTPRQTIPCKTPPRPLTPRQVTPRQTARQTLRVSASPPVTARQQSTALAQALQSPKVGAQLCTNTTTGFNVEDLHLGVNCARPDPSMSSLRMQVIEKLGVGHHSAINAMSGVGGGRNEGMWVVQDPRGALVLKLVRRRQGSPSEAEKFMKLYQEHPSIASDTSLAFPLKVFQCVGVAGERTFDIVVMRKVCGEQLTGVLHRLFHSSRHAELGSLLRQLGSFLKQFHRCYGNKQHGDFGPQNIFYDEASRRFCLVDIADLGLIPEGDVAHFRKSLSLLSGAYGQQFLVNCTRNFEEGYRQGR